MWEKSASCIPGLRNEMLLRKTILSLLNSFSMASCGMMGQTLDRIILLFGLCNLRILNYCSLIIIIGWLIMKLSTNALLVRNMHNRLFDTRKAKMMLTGFTILPIAIIYSLCGNVSFIYILILLVLFSELGCLL